MKYIKIFSIILSVLIIASCHSSKKSITSTASSTAPAPTTAPTNTTSTAPIMIAKSKTGVYAPGNEELAAIQVKYKDVTLQTLSDGYTLYTGVCTDCHGTKSIYNRAEDRWPDILEDMAQKSKLTAVEKDAVYKYVLAIKATQPK